MESDEHPDEPSQESLLEAMGSELERLRSLEEQAAPILRMLARRDELLKEKAALEAPDPSRLTSRRAPGRLLREERLRRACALELPRLTERLIQALRAWEAAPGSTPFLVDGASLLRQLEDDNRQERARAAPPTGRALALVGAGPGHNPRGLAARRAPTTASSSAGGSWLDGDTRSPSPGPRTQRPEPRTTPGTRQGGALGSEPRHEEGGPSADFKPVPLSLQQILAAADVAPSPRACGPGAQPEGPGQPRQTLTYRLRGDAVAAAAQAGPALGQRHTMAAGARRPRLLNEHNDPRKKVGGGTTGPTGPRTVESVIAMAARLKREADAAGAAFSDRTNGAGRSQAQHQAAGASARNTPSKAVLKAFAESSGVSSPADLIQLTPPGDGARASPSLGPHHVELAGQSPATQRLLGKENGGGRGHARARADGAGGH